MAHQVGVIITTGRIRRTFICKINLPQRLSANSANSLYQAARADQQVAESQISQLETHFRIKFSFSVSNHKPANLHARRTAPSC
jgi:transcription elongation GreA/GreB family factor